MKLEVLFFGAEAAAVGSRTASVEADGDAISADELKHMLAIQFPELGDLDACRVAVNQRFVEGDAAVTGSDEIAIVGPVSGG